MTLLAHRHHILNQDYDLYGYTVQLDSGASMQITRRHDKGRYWAVGQHGNLALVTITGRTIQHHMIRARIDFGTDTGRVDGQVTFGTGGHIGGRVNEALAP